MQREPWPAEWMRGVLELAVLRVLAGGRSYGYAIATALADADLGEIKGGTLYPLLGRLESSGLIASTWEAGDGGPGRKYLALTDAGRAHLDARVEVWQAFATTTTDFLATTAASAEAPSPGDPA